MLPINENLVSFNVQAKDAHAAIRAAGNLLVDEGKVQASYVDAMVKGFDDVGPYIVLAPSIAIPHARPEHGVNEKCVSFVILKEPVSFGHPTNDPVKLVCAIGGTDNTGHIEMLQELSGILGDSKRLNGIINSTSYQEFQKYITK